MHGPRDNVEPRWWTTSDGSVFLPTYSTSSTSLDTQSVTTQPGGTGIPISSPPSSSTSSSASISPSSSSPSDPMPGSSTTTGATATTTSIAIPVSYTITSAPISFTTTITTSSGGSLEIFTSTGVSDSLITSRTTSWSIVNVGGVSSPTSTPNVQNNARSICAGDGVDSMTIGVFSTLVFGLVVGAAIWVSAMLDAL